MTEQKSILITGCAGFISGYLVQELLENGWRVVGLDNLSKYGRIKRSFDNHPHYDFHEGDAKDTELLKTLLVGCDYLLAGAAMIGGIGYFHTFAYDLMAENERIMASTFDAAIKAFKSGGLKKIIVLSSSMVFESTDTFPTPEGAQLISPPPHSSYGFQKLACEYFALAAFEQHRLPYTIIRPFNCVGIGERAALCDEESDSGNITLAMSHVLPDLVQKALKGQDPLHILGDGRQIRHYTYGGDLASAIRIAIDHPAAVNEDFNISSPVSTTVLELAEMVWNKVNPGKPFRYVSDPPFEHDVRRRIPDTTKSQELLNIKISTPLPEVLDEVIPWIKEQTQQGHM